MNLISIVLAVILAVVIIIAAVRTWKNRGKCSGCSGNCEHCVKKL